MKLSEHDRELTWGDVLVSRKGKIFYIAPSPFEDDRAVVAPVELASVPATERAREEFSLPIGGLAYFANPPENYPANNRAYAAMLREAVRIGWPAHYKDDLLWNDAKKLGVHPTVSNVQQFPDGSQFGWILRESGTHIIGLETNPYNSAASYYAKETSVRTPSPGFYWWDGKNLVDTGSARGMIERHRGTP